jgi:catechol 2,3-dioxygenase-like lactoylglutathione lyase family enzyme
MFTHLFIGSNDVERSRKFYDAVMKVLGYGNILPSDAPRLIYAGPTGTLVVGPPLNGEAATISNGATIGFVAMDDDTVAEWHRVGLANGGTDEGAPGPRAAAPNNSVGAYLRDPDGHKICAFHMNV